MSTKSADARYLGRDEAPIPLEIAGASGSRVRDAQGRRYIDFTMGWCVGNLGWNHPDVMRRLRCFRGPSYVNPRHLYAPWSELAQRLVAIAPRGLRRCFRTTGGTEAVEVALQIAMVATKRRKIVSVQDAYHGSSIAAHSIGALDRKHLPNPLPHCEKLARPLDLKALGRLETLLAKRDVAAFIMEPVICNLAVYRPDDEFMRGLSALCRRHGSLLIMDEVATGFGRTGRMFACEHWNLEPDVVCLAKALSSGHAGIGATLATERAAHALKSDTAYSTYGWHPLGVEAALATLDVFDRDGAALLDNANRLGAYFLERLEAMRYAKRPKIRGAGLAIGLEFTAASHAKRLQERCRRNGLLVNDDGDGYVTLFPALNIPLAAARAGLDIFERCVSG